MRSGDADVRVGRPRRLAVELAADHGDTVQLQLGVQHVLGERDGLAPAQVHEAYAVPARLLVRLHRSLLPTQNSEVGLLPDALAFPLARLERYGIFIVLLFLFVLPYVGERTGLDLNVLGWLIGVPAEALYQFVLTITGQGE